MAYESIALQGYNTGGVKTPNTIRRGFAFDLTSVDLRDRVVVSATLQLRRTVGSTATSTVQLTDPANQCAYGRVAGTSRLGAIRIPLTADAIADLQQAGGGFFAVDAMCEGGTGESQRFPIGAGQPVVVLVVADAVGNAAAA